MEARSNIVPPGHTHTHTHHTLKITKETNNLFVFFFQICGEGEFSNNSIHMIRISHFFLIWWGCPPQLKDYVGEKDNKQTWLWTTQKGGWQAEKKNFNNLPLEKEEPCLDVYSLFIYIPVYISVYNKYELDRICISVWLLVHLKKTTNGFFFEFPKTAIWKDIRAWLFVLYRFCFTKHPDIRLCCWFSLS